MVGPCRLIFSGSFFSFSPLLCSPMCQFCCCLPLLIQGTNPTRPPWPTWFAPKWFDAAVGPVSKAACSFAKISMQFSLLIIPIIKLHRFIKVVMSGSDHQIFSQRAQLYHGSMPNLERSFSH